MTETKTSPARKRSIPVTTPKVQAVRCTAAIPSFDELPDSALIRQSQLVRDPKHPTRPTPLPFSPATFWRRVRDGSFPQPVRLGERFTCFRVGDVRAWLAAQQVGATHELRHIQPSPAACD